MKKRTREIAAIHEVTVRTLAEREALLRELHHRTRNNMQVISGILDTEADISGDPKVVKVVKDTLERIMAMSLVQKKLYDSQDLSRIDMREYFRELLDALTEDESFARERITLTGTEVPIPLLFDAAVPCGLVLRELVSNAIRHAYPGKVEGEIRVSIATSPSGGMEFRIEDDGKGLPPDFDFNRKDTLGMQLIKGLVESQLRGTVSFETAKGVSCQVIFSDARFSARV